MAFIDRIGIDFGRKGAIEEAIRIAADHGVRAIDCQTDLAPNALESFDAARSATVRAACAEHGIQLGLHTLSAVNIAEVSPFLRDAADRYLEAYIDLAARLQAGWIVVHAGYHFTADKELRLAAALARLERAVACAERRGVQLLLENMNREPDLAEVHYLGNSIEECRYLFDRIGSPALKWSFTINHATLVPEGIAGFLAAMPAARLGEVRLADNNGDYELHMFPGTGIIDFADAFRLIEATGYTGSYTAAFGTIDDMLRARAYLAECHERGCGTRDARG
jgi:sugar phosphate isomerase/epimerase